MNYLGPSLRRRPRRTRPWLTAVVALGVSLAVNGAVLWLLPVGGIVGSLRPGAPRRDVVLAPISRSQWEANRGPAAAPLAGRAAPIAPPVVVPPPPPPEPTHAPGQVVDVAPSKDATPPKDSRFVAEHDSSVEKQTRSRHRGPVYPNTAPVPGDPSARGRPEPAAPQGPPQVAVVGGGGREGKPGAPGQPRSQAAPPAPAPRPGQRLALRLDPGTDLRAGPGARTGGTPDPFTPAPAPTPAPTPGAQGAQGAGGEAGGGGRPLAPFQLRPSAAQYDRLAGGPAPDKLDGVEEGEGTYLNTRAWKYAGYFNRLKEQLRSEWNPQNLLMARDPSGSRFGDREWMTLVAVRLDDKGGLKDIQVQRGSGLDILDRLAVDAFRRAQPFQNPPPGLVKDGEIVFNFAFYVEPTPGGFGGFMRRAPPTGE